MHPRAILLRESESDSRLIALTFVISIIGHFIFFIVLVFTPGQMPSKKYLPTVVNVSLVSLPSPGPPSGSNGRAVVKANRQAAKSKSVTAPKPPLKKAVHEKRKPQKTVSVAPQKWKEKTSLKKKTFKPEKVVGSAIKRIEKKAEKSERDSVSAAIDRLRSKVGEAEATRSVKEEVAKGQESGFGKRTGLPPGGRLTGKLATEILLYQQEISYHIRNNWVFSEEVAGKRTDLEARLMIQITANGEIKDIWFEKRSGNRHLDESAFKAVVKSSPLPALPRGYQYYKVGLIFTPSGLQ
jgi:colicin import membrane protein